MNYNFMQIVFGSGVATGRFAMGSSKPLGRPVDHETIDLENMAVEAGKGARPSHNLGKQVEDNKGKQLEDNKVGKRKRVLHEDDVAMMSGMTTAMLDLSAAIKEGNHSEAALGIYDAVMDCPNFARSDLMVCLNYLMDHKATALVFVGMKPEDKELWINQHLAGIRGHMAFQ